MGVQKADILKRQHPNKEKHSNSLIMKAQKLFLFFLGLASISAVYGVKCFDGYTDATAEISYLEEKECKNELGNCVKHYGSMKIKDGWTYKCGSDEILEDQSNGCHQGPEWKRYDGGGNLIENALVCYCTGDLCNTAVSTNGFNMMLTILSLMVAQILNL